ncbi:MAG TPA: DUF2301 domain-containing membrane protein [Psychromonas sp.]
MADPQVKERLDSWDKFSITLYRLGMGVTALALLLLALQQLFYPYWFKHILVFLALGALLQASSLHIYKKSVRWILVNACWIGVWLVSLAFATSGLVAAYLSLGALFITLSGIAYKESFCFSLTLLKIMPLILLFTWFALFFAQTLWASGGFIVSAFLYLYMAWKKSRMPLFYDLGDRKKYEI